MDVSFAFFIVILLINFLIGFFIYLKGPKGKTNQYFFLLSISITLWILANFLENEQFFSIGTRRIFFALDFVFGILPGAFFNIFCSYFPGNKISKRAVIREYLMLPFLVIADSVIAFTDFIFKNIHFVGTAIDADPGMLFFFYFAFILWTIGDGLRILFVKYHRSKDKIERVQLAYIFFGFLFFTSIAAFINLILGSFLFIPVEISRIGIYSVIIFSLFTAIAITKYELFNLKLILTEILIGAIALILLYQAMVIPGLQWKLLDGTILVLFCFFGLQLVIANKKESQQREEAEFAAMRERAMRREAEDLAENLKNLNTAKTQFLLSTQHHLRSPLTVIQGYLSLISEGDYGKIPDIVKAKIDISLESAQKLINLINEMLDVAHFQMNKGSVDIRPTDIATLVGGIIDDLAANSQAKNIYLRFNRLASEYPLAAVDPRGIREAIYNIVDNAIKYTQSGGVTVLLASADGKLRISVVDTGIGMNDFDRRNIFNRTFERGAKAKEVNATGKGIGLYLAGQMIINNGGTIRVASAGRGKGSTFIVELPTVNDVPNKILEAPVPKPPAKP